MVLGIIIAGTAAIIIVLIIIKLIRAPNKTDNFEKTNCIVCGRKTNSLICPYCKKNTNSLK